MEYRYKFRNTPGDFFLFNMSNIYSQWTAIVNVLFTAALIILTITRWGTSSDVLRAFMLIGVFLFPVIQPLVIYIRAMAQAKAITEETELSFDNSGMHIQVKDHKQLIKWSEYKTVIKRKALLILIPDGSHAYILTNRILMDQKDYLYQFIVSKTSGK
ncbi:MAG: YcxB family protein [Butyrivibrio sp.]|nr:YcxB family protein [Butyrivibrio sp.]